MSLFDDVEIYYPLPGDPPDFKTWQSKSAECGQATYRITEDGRLERLAGSSFGEQFAAEEVDSLERTGPESWVDQHHHGSFRIYNCTSWPSGYMREWWEYHIIFIDGKIHDVRRVNAETRADPAAKEKPDEC